MHARHITTYFRRTAYSAAIHKAPPADNFGLPANWGDRVMRVVAATIALLVVAASAVLMGLAGHLPY